MEISLHDTPERLPVRRCHRVRLLDIDNPFWGRSGRIAKNIARFHELAAHELDATELSF
jgi:hypothetical protein